MNQNRLQRPQSAPGQLLRLANGTPTALSASPDPALQNAGRTRHCGRIHEPALPFSARSGMSRFDKGWGLAWLALALLFCLFVLPTSVKGQLDVTSDFNTGTDIGWSHYTPTTA